MDRVSLFVSGQQYEGWKSAVIKKSVRSLSGAFRLSVTDNWSGSGSIFFIKPGDKCNIKVGSDAIITGYVEQVDSSFSANNHTITVGGRDKTGDLIDSSAIYGSGEILNSNLKSIAEHLVQPFGINVIARASVGRSFDNFSIQPGETVFDSIERAARMRGVLLSSNENGDLVLTKLAENRSSIALIEGKNIKSASLSLDTTNRFSKYIVKGQITGTDENSGEQASEPEDTATDSIIDRYRPLVLIAEDQASQSDSRSRAAWESAVRAAESSQVEVTVQGFRQSEGGALWAPNTLVYFESPLLGLKQEMLIIDVEMTASDQGSETRLVLQRPDAFKPSPEVSSTDDPLSEYAA